MTLSMLPLIWFLLPESLHFLLCRRPARALQKVNRVLQRLGLDSVDALPEARLYPAEIRTTGVGWGIGLGRFGAVIAPYIAGVLIAAGWGISILFIVFAVPLVLGGWITYSIRSKALPR